MAVGGLNVTSGARAAEYEGRMTWRVFITCAMAACGGLLFGYDLGVTGGVTGMPAFLETFFPNVIAAKERASAQVSSPYCQFDDMVLQLWTSSMFLAGAFAGIATIIFKPFFQRIGRKGVMISGGVAFVVGAALQAGAVNMGMLIIGRLFLGLGIGFANQAVPIYISEMAPHKYRGALNIIFQLMTTLGIVVASLINYLTQDHPWGWRMSIGLAGVPALVFLIGSCILDDSPNSLLLNYKETKGRQVLVRMRGTDNVGAEWADIQAAVEEVKAHEVEFWKSLAVLFSPRFWKLALASVAIPFFQQFTGMNAIMFYAPQIFQVMGMGVRASLMSSMITNCVNFCATFIAILTVDRFGRKPLFFVAGVTMFIMQTATAALTGLTFTGGTIPQEPADAMIVFICIFVSCFAFSWGPLGWLVPSEIHPLETRATGQAVTVFTNFMASFIIGQFFNSMLCKMQFGVFLFFAAFVAIMTVYVWIMLPETKGVPIEEIMDAWAMVPINPFRREDRASDPRKTLKQRTAHTARDGERDGHIDTNQNADLRA
ncbi:hypothetical protein WJX75_009367 [Coccomyxa subellipsoidea]|uniref:Major facilitator superfamily (MFS) profile domain-containing protein n=1 Tax=Coccomyxa subellipsoidea TaxID=248742 RepID=A0ABR2YUU2_9CHLO